MTNAMITMLRGNPPYLTMAGLAARFWNTEP